MTDTPAETLRHAARVLRIQGRTYESGSRRRAAHFALAGWFEAEANALSEHETSPTLDQALAIARTYLNGDDQ